VSSKRGSRLGGAMARARLESERAREYAEDARARSPVVDLGLDVIERDRLRLGGLLSGALAFRLFLWLLPFTLVLVGALGAVTAIVGDAPDDLSDELGLQGVLADLVREGGRQRGWWIALLIGLAGTAYAGLGAMRALSISHAAAWGIRPERLRRPLWASLWLFVVVVGLLALSGVSTWLRERSGPVGSLVTILVVGIVFAVVWLRVSASLPHRDVPRRMLVPGAILVAVGAQGLNLLTVYYLAGQAERATSTYGAIGAALTILLWLFILARLAVAGAMLNAELTQRAARRREA